jgi:hypothetical protein
VPNRCKCEASPCAAAEVHAQGMIAAGCAGRARHPGRRRSTRSSRARMGSRSTTRRRRVPAEVRGNGQFYRIAGQGLRPARWCSVLHAERDSGRSNTAVADATAWRDSTCRSCGISKAERSRRCRQRNMQLEPVVRLGQEPAMTIRRIEPGPRMSQAVVHGGIAYLAGQVGAPAPASPSRPARCSRRSTAAGRGRLDKSRILTGDDLARRHRHVRRDELGVGHLGRSRPTRLRAPPARASSRRPSTRWRSSSRQPALKPLCRRVPW